MFKLGAELQTVHTGHASKKAIRVIKFTTLQSFSSRQFFVLEERFIDRDVYDGASGRKCSGC